MLNLFQINQFESRAFTFLKSYIFHLLRQDYATGITRVATEDSIDNKDNLDSVAGLASVDSYHAKIFFFFNV